MKKHLQTGIEPTKQASAHPTRRTEAFFGRRKGQRLHAGQMRALADELPKRLIDLDHKAPGAPGQLFFSLGSEFETVFLEIGFGGGEHVIEQAQQHPDIGFIGVEPFENGMAKALKAAADTDLKNFIVYNDDATELLDWLPPACLSRIDLLYPDPWPKKKHWKRRFVSLKNLSRFHRVLKEDGLFRFASDIDTYVNWTLQHVRIHGGFQWLAEKAGDWREPWPEWHRTRYEAKAIRENRNPCYLRFRKRSLGYPSR